MTWRPTAPTSGPASRASLGAILVLGLGWLAWPVWSSFTAPDRAAVTALTPALLAALLGLILLLTWALWRDAGHRAQSFAPIVTVAALAAGTRMFLTPRVSGLEPVFALPLLAGAALGSPAGFLTGALACLGSSAAMGLVAEPLVGQCLAWGLWGAAGGLLRGMGPRAVWAGAIALCLPLGIVSGLGLNLIGWAGERTAQVGAFLPGVGAWESAQRLWAYTRSTSSAVDLPRAASAAGFVAVVGLPILRALKAMAPPPPPPPLGAAPHPPGIAPGSLLRRERSDRLTTLWQDSEGEPHEHTA